MSIQVKNIRKQFGSFTALKDVSSISPPASWWPCWALRLRQDHAAAHHRRAGVGRRRPGAARRQDASDTHVRERQVGFVFQHYALFRHMTVFDNVAFGMRMKPRSQRPSEARSRPR
jgi:sulfate transport system ATP-binding protein